MRLHKLRKEGLTWSLPSGGSREHFSMLEIHPILLLALLFPASNTMCSSSAFFSLPVLGGTSVIVRHLGFKKARETVSSTREYKCLSKMQILMIKPREEQPRGTSGHICSFSAGFRCHHMASSPMVGVPSTFSIKIKKKIKVKLNT